MIARASIENASHGKSAYFIYIHFKKEYHSKFGQLTGNNIGNFLAIIYKDEIISPTLPVVKARLTHGTFSIGLFNKEKEAERFFKRY